MQNNNSFFHEVYQHWVIPQMHVQYPKYGQKKKGNPDIAKLH